MPVFISEWQFRLIKHTHVVIYYFFSLSLFSSAFLLCPLRTSPLVTCLAHAFLFSFFPLLQGDVTVLLKTLILIASVVKTQPPPSFLSWPLPAINKIACRTAVIAGRPCLRERKLRVRQFFVWPIFIDNKWGGKFSLYTRASGSLRQS